MPRPRIQAIISEENRAKIKDNLVDGHRSQSDVIREGVALLYEQETGEELEINAGRSDE
jgi:Arc/MetJ-type ribon-helix-helix transcriptional regulator